MEKFYYESPTIEREEDALDYLKEFYDYHSRINGVGGLDKYTDNYSGWIEKIEKDTQILPTEERVPAETYFLIRENDHRIIGMVNIRLTLNENLRHIGGHIGYSIRPTERRKGYNKINLYLALKVCQDHGIEEAILTCDKTNIASSKTMLALGAQLEEEFEVSEIIEQKYKINVAESLEKYKDYYAPHIQKRR